MKSFIYPLLITVLLISCGSKKSLETTAPFSLGETYAQQWNIRDRPAAGGYEVVITILSLTEEKAALKNLYHLGKMAPVSIELRNIGTVAVAEFGPVSTTKSTAADTTSANTKIDKNTEKEVFPFELTETQAVISYVEKKKVRYYKIDGIQRNLPITCPNQSAKTEQ
ncbi:MAG: hypothetical protein WBG48_15480 [Pricia sp.]